MCHIGLKFWHCSLLLSHLTESYSTLLFYCHITQAYDTYEIEAVIFFGKASIIIES